MHEQHVRDDVTAAAAWVERCVEPMIGEDDQHMNAAMVDYAIQAAKQWKVTIGSIRHALVQRQAARMIATLDAKTRKRCG